MPGEFARKAIKVGQLTVLTQCITELQEFVDERNIDLHNYTNDFIDFDSNDEPDVN